MHRTVLRVTLLASGLTALFLFRALDPGVTFIARDIHRVYLPVKAFWSEQVRSGHLPGWYPFDALGQPFAAATVTASFHPFNLLFLVLSAVDALRVQMLCCFV